MIAQLHDANLLDHEGQPTSLRDAARYLKVSPSTVWRAFRKTAQR